MQNSFYRFFLILISLVLLLSCSPVPVEPISQPVDPRYIIRGKELVNGLAACGACHGKNLTGKDIYDFDGNEVFAANLTNASEVGSTYLFALVKASGMDNDSNFSSWAHKGYEWMSDEDTLSVVAYLKLLDPLRLESNHGIQTDRENSEFITDSIAATGYVPQINKNAQTAYGKYLVDNVARCQVCHNGLEGFFSDEEYLAGGKTLHTGSEEITVPSLKISSWSESQIINYLKTGSKNQLAVKPGRSSSAKAKICPTEFYSKASNQDLLAITTYLKSLAG